MRRALKIAGLILAGLALLVGLIVLLLPYLVNLETVRSRLAQELSRRLKAQVSIEKVELRLLPSPALKTEKVKIIAPKFGLYLARGDLVLELGPLLHRRIEVKKFLLKEPVIVLKEAPSGPKKPEKEKGPPFESLFSKARVILAKSPALVIEIEDGKLQKKTRVTKDLLTGVDASLGLRKDFLELELSGKGEGLSELKLTFKMWPEEAIIEGLLRLRHADLSRLPWEHKASFLKELKTDLNLDLSYRLEDQSWLFGFTATAPCLIKGKSPLFFDCSTLLGKARYKEGNLKVTLEELTMKNPLLEARGSFTKDKEKSAFDFYFARADWGEIKKRLLVFLGQNKGFLRFAEIVQDGLAYETHFRSEAKTPKALFKLENLTYEGKAKKARIKVPRLGLLLTEVSGKVAVRRGELEVREARASYQDLSLSQAALRLPLRKLKEKKAPFFFEARFKGPFSRVREVLLRLPLPEKVSEKVGNLSGQGHLAGRVKVSGLLHRPKVSFELHPRALTLNYAPFPYPLRLNQGTISYRDRTVGGRGLSLSTPKSRFFLSFRLDFRQKPWHLELSEAQGPLNLNEVLTLLQRVKGVKPYLSRFRVSGKEITVIEASYRGPLSGPSILSKGYLKASGKNLKFTHAFFPAPLTFKKVSFSYQNYAFSFGPSEVALLDGAFTATGELRLKPFALSLNGNGSAGETFTSWVYEKAHLPRAFFPRTPLRLSNFEFVKDEGNLRFSGKIETVPPSWAKLVFEKKGPGWSLAATLFPRGKEAFSLKLAKRENFSLGLHGRITAQDLGLFFAQNPFLLREAVTDFEGIFDLEEPARSLFFGTLKLSGFRVPSKGYPFWVKTLDLQAEKRKLRLKEGVFNLDHTRLNGHGVLTFSQKYLNFEGELFSPEIKVEEVQKIFARRKKTAKKDGPHRRGLAGFFSRVKLIAQVRITTEKATYHGFEFRPLKGVVFYHPGKLRFVVERSEICGIKLVGSVTQAQGERELKLSFSQPEGHLEETLFCLFKTNDFEGPFELKGELITTGHERLFEKSHGRLFLRSEKGHIDKFGALAKLFAVLSPIDIFSGNLPDFSRKGMDYDLLELKGKFKKDYLKVEAFQLNAPGLRIFGTGKVFFLKKEVDLTLLVSPFKTFNAVVSKVPLIGWVLTGKSKMLIALPVKVSGPVKDPSILPLDPVSLGSQFLGIVERTFKLPVKILTPNQKEK